MNKALSLNTQLIKLRSVIKLLKDSIPFSIIKTESGHTDLSHKTCLQDIIYSLRDIQYELRGLTGYKAKRSKQVNHYSIDEIMGILLIEQNSNASDKYKDAIGLAYADLLTVAYYISSINLSKDELF